MGKPLTPQKKAQNKVALDEARGANPDPKDVLVAAGKTPKPSGPMTREIDVLIARRKAIMGNQARAQENLAKHQGRLDAAESEASEYSVMNMADPSDANSKLASDARMNVNTIRQLYDMAKHELSITPGTLNKLKSEISTLQAKKRIEEKALIAIEVPDIEVHRQAAIEANAQYVAYVCLTGERQPAYLPPSAVMAKLNNKKEVTAWFEEIYAELEENMGFEKL